MEESQSEWPSPIRFFTAAEKKEQLTPALFLSMVIHLAM